MSVINGTTSKVVATVPVGSNPTAATWDSGNGYVYVPNEQSANVSVLGATAYAVTFTEAGLPANTEWWVNVTGQGPQVSTTATITLHLADGGYTYAVSTVDKTYQASGGSFTVNGSPESETVAFTQRTYTVTFTESGITFRGGAQWNVTLNGVMHTTSIATVSFSEPNGTYSYSANSPGWQPSPTSDNVTVSGRDQSISISFTLTTYPVTFTQIGLPTGASWNVTLGGTAQTSTTTTNAFSEPNGTYAFDLGLVTGYTVSPYSGIITVRGAGVTKSITFTALAPGTYPVTFDESGLPGGTNWSVTSGEADRSSTGSAIVFTEPNGTYGFTVGSIPGYSASPADGTITVQGYAVSASISFGPTATNCCAHSYPPPLYQGPTFLGLPATEGYALLGGIIAALVLAAAVAILLSRRKKAPPEPATTPAEPDAPAPPPSA